MNKTHFNISLLPVWKKDHQRWRNHGTINCFTLHYGLWAVISKKNIAKSSTLEVDFSANFHPTHDFVLVEALLTPQKLETKNWLTNINLRACKTQKREGGVFYGQNGSQNFRFYKCFDICFYSFGEKHPHYGKNASKVWKTFFKYLTSLFGCCRRPSVWFVTLLPFSPSSSSALSSTDPSFIYLEYLHAEKWWSRLKFLSELFGCGKNEGESCEILNDIAPIALIP